MKLKAQKVKEHHDSGLACLRERETISISQRPILEGNVGFVHVGMDKGIIMSQMQSAMVQATLPPFGHLYHQYLHGIFLREQNIPASEQTYRLLPKNLPLMIFPPQSISVRRMKSVSWLIP